MHTYRKATELNLKAPAEDYVVGYYVLHGERVGDISDVTAEFMTLVTCHDEATARRYVNYLNGGTGNPMLGV